MFKQVPTNECEVVATPRSPGNFGFMRTSVYEPRKPEEEYRLCEEIKRSIQKHVDDLEYVDIRRKYVYEHEGEQYNTLFELLENVILENHWEYYNCHYARPSDNGVGTSRTLYDFKKVIEEAYYNPWEFRVSFCSPKMTEDQHDFLQKVIQLGLEHRHSKCL